VEPGTRFMRHAKHRLLERIVFDTHERWFVTLLKRLGGTLPSSIFVQQARVRLVERINTPSPVLHGFLFLKRLAASTLVMTLAVTSTLFYVDGRQVVNASEDTYLEVTAGNVHIKRADRLIWDVVGVSAELSAGDLIRVDEDAAAIVHFFDDTELRLGGNATLLIGRLESSPAFTRQGNIEVSLHQGQAWVQTLSVDDHFAGFTLVTRDLIVNTLNSSFDIATSWNQPSVVRAFKNNVTLNTLHPDLREVISTFPLPNDREFKAIPSSKNISLITEAERVSLWVQANLEQDHGHLALLRAREFENVHRAVGVLPGQMLYPIKLAKERFQLALSFDANSLTQTQIDIANKRLNEAIVLLEKGDQKKAWESLMAYQNVTREIANNPGTRGEISQQIIARNQRTLVASLSTDVPVRFVTEALNQTKELIAENPLEREQVRLENSVERLAQVTDLISVGDLVTAKEALTEHQLVTTDILDQAAGMEDSDAQKAVFEHILTLRQQEASLIAEIMTTLEARTGSDVDSDTQLMGMVAEADRAAKTAVKDTIAFIRPLAPAVVKQAIAVPIVDQKVKDFVSKVLIYKTLQGQKNQITRLLQRQGAEARDISFLRKVRNQLPVRAQSLINSRILELQSRERLDKHKATKQKMDLSKSLRD